MNKNLKLYEGQSAPEHSLVSGAIDVCNNLSVFGWIHSPIHDIHPVLIHNGIPLRCISSNIVRHDVSDTLGISASDVGFEFEIASLKEDDELILYGASKDDFIFVCKKSLQMHIPETNFFNQLENAIEISKKDNSIAITCWDGAHNPLGRAKVLYDILKSKSDPLLISYANKDFGTQIWKPMINSKVNHLQIPWQERHKYEKYIHKLNISFDTIWVCKNRYPSFLLASLFSHKETSLILDIDDMEREFSKGNDQKHKSYGKYTNNAADYYTNLISTKTSPSITLSKYYNSSLIRHTRYPKSSFSEKLKDKSNIDIVFIGTVRSHKNIIGLAEKINDINNNTDKQLVLHIYGDIPKKDQAKLDSLGVVTYFLIPLEELQDTISSYDICVSGYPNVLDEINKYQISSKIGDALSVSRPILVPASESVQDLDNINGVHLFNEENFEEVLDKVINSRDKISLPDQFNTLKNYSNFEVLRKSSMTEKKANVIFNKKNTKRFIQNKKNKVENILFIWKQHDAGIYGRRIDIAARDFKKNNPNKNVFVLQFMHEDDYINISKNKDSFINHNQYIVENINGVEIDEVHYSTLTFKRLADLERDFDKFLLSKNITSSNSSVVIFPYINYLETLMRVLKCFKIIVDVVDNQLEWASEKQKPKQLTQLVSLCNIAQTIIFNSEINLKYFEENGFINNSKKVAVIPNWYNTPPLLQLCDFARHKEKRALKNIFYSGNLNDRFDWVLLLKLARNFSDINIHLVGTASITNGWMEAINQYKNIIYHGPLPEKDNLRLLSQMDLTIMPHLPDNISKYMNPLKVQMYSRLGIETIAMSVNGITENKYLKIVDNHEDFIKMIANNKLVHINDNNDNDYKASLAYENILKNL